MKTFFYLQRKYLSRTYTICTSSTGRTYYLALSWLTEVLLVFLVSLFHLYGLAFAEIYITINLSQFNHKNNHSVSIYQHISNNHLVSWVDTTDYYAPYDPVRVSSTVYRHDRVV